MVTIEYGRWTYVRTLLEEEQLRVSLDYVLGWEQAKAARDAKREGMELLPGPPERRVHQLDPFGVELVRYIWPVCRVMEEEQ